VTQSISQLGREIFSRTFESREVAETAVKRLLCCGFRCAGKAADQLVEDMSRIKYFFQIRIAQPVLYPFVTYLQTLPRT
jgi:hypothetical protein